MSKQSVCAAFLLAFSLVVSACATPQVVSTAAPTLDVHATETVVANANNNQMATGVAATLTAQPTGTTPPTNTPLPSNTPVPSNTPTLAPSATATTAANLTPAPSATRTKGAVAATQPPAATTPAPTKAPSGGGSVYSTASGGPQGYTSTLGCTQAGAACVSSMPTGDVAFSIRLESALDSVLAIFVPFGLAVEKDGANAANMYMTVDAGWLSPGTFALMGTSRNFDQPGHYVIRTNGCLITEATYPACTWWTVNGTIVTFDIH